MVSFQAPLLFQEGLGRSPLERCLKGLAESTRANHRMPRHLLPPFPDPAPEAGFSSRQGRATLGGSRSGWHRDGQESPVPRRRYQSESWASDASREVRSNRPPARPCPPKPTRERRGALGSWARLAAGWCPAPSCKLTHWARRPPWETVIMILSEKLSASTSVWTPLTVPATLLDLAGKGSALTESPSMVG